MGGDTHKENKFLSLSASSLTSFHLFSNFSSKGKVKTKLAWNDYISQNLAILFSFHFAIGQQNSTAGSQL